MLYHNELEEQTRDVHFGYKVVSHDYMDCCVIGFPVGITHGT